MCFNVTLSWKLNNYSAEKAVQQNKMSLEINKWKLSLQINMSVSAFVSMEKDFMVFR